MQTARTARTSALVALAVVSTMILGGAAGATAEAPPPVVGGVGCAVNVPDEYPLDPYVQGGPHFTFRVGQSYSLQISLDGKGSVLCPVRFGVAPLPPGLTLNSATGAITGSPTEPGEWNATVTAWYEDWPEEKFTGMHLLRLVVEGTQQPPAPSYALLVVEHWGIPESGERVELAAPELDKLEVGQKYSTAPITVDGWQFLATEGDDQHGVLGDGGARVVFLYTPVVEQPAPDPTPTPTPAPTPTPDPTPDPTPTPEPEPTPTPEPEPEPEREPAPGLVPGPEPTAGAAPGPQRGRSSGPSSSGPRPAPTSGPQAEPTPGPQPEATPGPQQPPAPVPEPEPTPAPEPDFEPTAVTGALPATEVHAPNGVGVVVSLAVTALVLLVAGAIAAATARWKTVKAGGSSKAP